MCGKSSDVNKNRVQNTEQCFCEHNICAEKQCECKCEVTVADTNTKKDSVEIQVLNGPLIAIEDVPACAPAPEESTEIRQHDCKIIQAIETNASEEIVGKVPAIAAIAVQLPTPVHAIDAPGITSAPQISINKSQACSIIDLSSPCPTNVSIISIYDDCDEFDEETVKLNITQDLFSNLSIIDDSDHIEPEEKPQVTSRVKENPKDENDNFAKDISFNSSNFIVASDAPQIGQPLAVENPKVELNAPKTVPATIKVKPVSIVSSVKCGKRKRTDDDVELNSNINVDIPVPKRFKTQGLKQLPNLAKNLIKHEPETQYWTSNMQSTSLFKIYKGCEEYQLVMDQFTEYDNQNDYRILRVERVENPTLMAGFVLKRQELEARKPLVPVQTRLLFHATDFHATQAIIRDNFDWRLAGRSRGHKYGHGTCFSPYSDWSTQFGHPDRNNVYYTLLCYVMERKTVDGHAEMVIPAQDYDTSTSRDGKVVVKYHDNTSYPAYRISYRKYEHYYDDPHMQRTEWAYAHHGNNYHGINLHYSQFNVNARQHVSHIMQNANFSSLYDDRHHHYGRHDRKKNHRHKRRYLPY